MPILGASSVKKAFTSSHDRGINISGVGSFSASLKYVQRYLAEEYGRRAPRRKRIWERALVRTDHFFDLILAERCLEPPDRLLVPELEDASDRVCGIGLGIEGLGVTSQKKGFKCSGITR